MSIGRWEPVWLGPPSRSLYAAVHPAAGQPSTGVVLVPPLLGDMPRSRRLITEVASELAALGLPSLRFDFLGTGDSSGDGNALDFDSMQDDLDVASAALRARTGVARLVLLAWRGAALALGPWLARGGAADLIVLWDPVTDGAAWLRELVDGDAAQRAVLPPPRPGVPRLSDAADGQLMGFKASARLRQDLAGARLARDAVGDAAPVWAVVPADADDLPMDVDRVFRLPATAPAFGRSASPDAMVFFTPPVRDVVAELGLALLGRTTQ